MELKQEDIRDKVSSDLKYLLPKKVIKLSNDRKYINLTLLIFKYFLSEMKLTAEGLQSGVYYKDLAEGRRIFTHICLKYYGIKPKYIAITLNKYRANISSYKRLISEDEIEIANNIYNSIKNKVLIK